MHACTVLIRALELSEFTFSFDVRFKSYPVFASNMETDELTVYWCTGSEWESRYVALSVYILGQKELECPRGHVLKTSGSPKKLINHARSRLRVR